MKQPISTTVLGAMLCTSARSNSPWLGGSTRDNTENFDRFGLTPQPKGSDLISSIQECDIHLLKPLHGFDFDTVSTEHRLTPVPLE